MDTEWDMYSALIGTDVKRKLGRRQRGELYMLREHANDLAPVSIGIDKQYRLVVQRVADNGTGMNVIYLGDRLCRWVEDKHLPELIRIKIAMIDVMDTDWESRMTYYGSRGGSGGVSAYQYPYKCPEPRLIEVGWRVDNATYTVIAPLELIDSLRGEPLNKELK